MIAGLYYKGPYNGEPMKPVDVHLLYNEVAARVGPPLVRQQRVMSSVFPHSPNGTALSMSMMCTLILPLSSSPDKCKVHKLMTNVSSDCNVEYSFLKEDKEDYLKGWQPITNEAIDEKPVVDTPWTYKTVLDLGGK